MGQIKRQQIYQLIPQLNMQIKFPSIPEQYFSGQQQIWQEKTTTTNIVKPDTQHDYHDKKHIFQTHNTHTIWVVTASKKRNISHFARSFSHSPPLGRQFALSHKTPRTTHRQPRRNTPFASRICYGNNIMTGKERCALNNVIIRCDMLASFNVQGTNISLSQPRDDRT